MTVSVTSVSVSPTSFRRGDAISVTFSATGKIEPIYGTIYSGFLYSYVGGMEETGGYVNSGPNYSTSWTRIVSGLDVGTYNTSVKVTANSKSATRSGPRITILPAKSKVNQITSTRANANGIAQYDGTYCVVGIRAYYDTGNVRTIAAAPKLYLDGVEVNIPNWYYTYDATTGLSDQVVFSSITDSSVTMFCLVNLGDASVHTIRVVAYDTYGEGQGASRIVPRPFQSMFDFKEGGAGVGIGCNATSDALLIGMPLVLFSPNGTKYQIAVSNGGGISVSEFIG